MKSAGRVTEFRHKLTNSATGRLNDYVLIGLLFAASFTLWDPLDIDERVFVQRLTVQSALSVRRDLEADIGSHLEAQVRLAEVLGWEEPDQIIQRGVATTSHHRPQRNIRPRTQPRVQGRQRRM